MNGSRQDSCHGKVRYETRTDAKRAAKKTGIVRDAQEKDRLLFDEYKCEHCAGWHLGTSNSVEVRQRRLKKQRMRAGREMGQGEAADMAVGIADACQRETDRLAGVLAGARAALEAGDTAKALGLLSLRLNPSRSDSPRSSPPCRAAAAPSAAQ